MGYAALAGGHAYTIVTIASGGGGNCWRGGFSISNREIGRAFFGRFAAG